MDNSHLAPTIQYGPGVGSRPSLSRHTSNESPCHIDFDANKPSSKPVSVIGAMDAHRPKKLVLCFDGTGNKFKGDDSDSNILKIFRMLDRTSDDQYHYYQPGIGTYIVSKSLSHTGRIARLRSWYMKAKDSAVGSSFDQHVVGGYRFLMRFYSPGDEIYIFGFSRGAYTARFLAEMLDYVGLLSHGNEEMISFAWKAFAQWQCRRSNTSPKGIKTKKEMYRFMKGFRETFSRPVRRIRFLGLFDTVNSVPRFETAWMERSKFPYTARTSARVVRHAVSIDERRAKFRQDLMYQSDQAAKSKKHHHEHTHHHLPHHNGHQDKAPDSPVENEKYRRRSVAVPGKRNDRLQVEDRGRRATLPVPDLDMAPFRARSRSARSHASGISTTGDNRSGRLSTDAASEVSRPQSPTHGGDHWEDSDDEAEQDIDEVWFAGGHGDVGGGWEIEPGTKSASHVPLAWMVREAIKAGLAFDWEKVREMDCLDALDLPPEANGQPPDLDVPAHEPNIPGIMIRSPSGNTPSMMDAAAANGAKQAEEVDRLQFDVDDHHDRSRSAFHEMMHRAHLATVHDSLAWHCGMGFTSVLSWRIMEYMPFRRMDLQADGSWKPIRWPLPCGEVRDIPDNARIHGSVIRRMQNDEGYRPGNLIVGGGGRGCRVAPKEHGMGEWVCVANKGDPIGEVWVKKGKVNLENEEEDGGKE